MKPLIAAVIAILLLAAPSLGENSRDVVTSDAAAQAIMQSVEQTMEARFGLVVHQPLDVGIDRQEQIDAVTHAHGHTGYHFLGTDGVHHIHCLTGQTRASVTEIMAHEYGHCWQDENCPQPQDKILAEGFAQWTAYHYLRHVGLPNLADGLFRKVDKDYITGLNLILSWEDRYGQAGLISLMTRIKSHDDVPERLPAADSRP